MRGLGYQLHNVVRDDVTDLFRNPVTIYHLEKSLFLANYENPGDPERIILRGEIIGIPGPITIGPNPIVIEKGSKFRFSSVSFSSGQFQTLPVNMHYLSIGLFST